MPSLDNSTTIKVKTESDTSGLKDTSNELDKLDQSNSRVSKSAAALGAATRVGIAGIVAIGAATAAATISGFGFNSSVEQATATINAFTKDAGLTKQILADVKAESLKTQFGFTEMANATASLIPASKMSGVALKDLVKQAEILAALNPSEGLEGAAFSLKEALSGDFVSIVERFNLPRKRLNELKAEGVPAMEAISRSLQEMGIDYSLVSEQGKTTAARWATMKDQFQQLAGAVSKPIFDRVSVALGQMAEKIDWKMWGDRGINAVNNLFDSGERLWSNLQKLWGIADQYLGPSFGALWNTLSTKLWPEVERGMPLIQTTATLLGITLGAAIWLVINGLNIAVTSISWVAKALNDGNPFIWGFVGALGVLAAALALNAGVAAFGAAMTTIRTGFVTTSALLSSPITMPAILIGAAIASLVMVYDQAKKTLSAIDAANASKLSYENGQLEIQKNLQNLRKNGTPEQKARAIETGRKLGLPGFASGGFTGRGGADEIAGLVHKGEYVVPKSQVDQETGQPKSTITIQNLILPGVTDRRSFLESLDEDSMLLGRGLTPNRGMR